MFLVVCATDLELKPLIDRLPPDGKGWTSLVTGVGQVETVLSLTRFLEQRKGEFQRVLNIGVAGAYLHSEGQGADLLEVCLAEEEILGDFGICYPDRIEPLAESLVHHSNYKLDPELLHHAAVLLRGQGVLVKQGTFVTVCGVSATEARGNLLGKQYDALCENMEGAAVARVCEAYGLPLLEMRAISNFVEDRDLSRWKMDQACSELGRTAALLLEGLIEK